jgi:hypothetical protein
MRVCNRCVLHHRRKRCQFVTDCEFTEYEIICKYLHVHDDVLTFYWLLTLLNKYYLHIHVRVNYCSKFTTS